MCSIGRFASAFFLILTSAVASTPPAQLLSRLPLRFEESKKGGDRYVAHGAKFALGLRPIESRIGTQGGTVSMILRGANSRARMEPVDRLPGTANYFLGGRENWKTDVAGYGRVRSNNVYPGIDLVFHGEEGKLEYDFIVAPHSDPGKIRLAFQGQSDLRIDSNGDLVTAIGGEEIRWNKPVIYQEFSGRRDAVDGRFVIRRSEVAFELGAYDRERTLIIDPVVSFATYLGGNRNDAAKGIAVDPQGNVYIAGDTNSTNLLTSASAAQPNFGGTAAISPFGDAFIAKFNPSGGLVYLTYLGGSSNDGAMALAVDSTGAAYITGATTSSTDFPLVNPYQKTFGGMFGAGPVRTGDAFAAKLNPAGNQLVYSTYLGGNADDIGTAIVVDALGNAYIAGATLSNNFPTSQNAYQRNVKGSGGEPLRSSNNQPSFDPGDAFAIKLDVNGQLAAGTLFGGTLDDMALTIALDPAGHVYIGGSTLSSGLPTTSTAISKSFSGSDIFNNQFLNFGDGFIAEFDSAFTTLMYCTYFGGSGDDTITAMAIDASGIYFTGSTSSVSIAVSKGAFQNRYIGYPSFQSLPIEQLYGDAYVAKITTSSSTPIYFSYLGGTANDAGSGIAIDSAGNAYVTGWTDSYDFQMAGSPAQPLIGGVGPNIGTYDGGQGNFIFYGDAFLVVVNPIGTQLIYSTFLGGNQDDEGYGIAIDTNGNVYVTGNTISTNFPVTGNVFQKNFGGGVQGAGGIIYGDAFLAKYSGFAASGPTPPVLTLSSNSASFFYTIGGAVPAADPITVSNSNTGSGTLNWTAASDSPSWLSATPSGSTPGTLTISVNITGLAASSAPYSGNITVTAAGATNGPQVIHVTLTVSAANTGGGGGGTTGSVLPGLPHFAAQNVWTFGVFVINTGNTTANFKISFFDDNGNPVTLPFTTPATSQLSGSIPPLGSAYYEASNPSAILVSGWGQINADPNIVIQALFRENWNGNYYEASVPSNTGSKEFEIPFDATTFAATGDQFFTGFAIANLDPSTQANIVCTAHDQSGALIDKAFTASTGPPSSLHALGHWAGFLFPALTGIRGTIDCTSSTTIAAIALRFIGSNAFSSLPVINKPAAASPATSALSHFAAQDVWTTGFFVVNTGTTFANFNIAFRNDAGNPVQLLFTTGPSANLTGSLPPGGSAYYETVDPQNGQLVSGWAQIVSQDPGIVIQALFRENSGGLFYEAAVPSNAGSFEFEIPFDATNFAAAGTQFFTGFAIANLDPANAANITCTARDQSGNVIPNAFNGITGPPQLSPLGHWAGYLFPELTGKRGTIDCLSTNFTKIAATALRFIGSGAFSSFPVINK